MRENAGIDGKRRAQQVTEHTAQTALQSPWRLCVAPMMEWTDRHCRHFHRLLAPDARLYTEMVVVQAAIHGDRERLLGYDASEHPLALQLGGSDPVLLARAARIGADFGYDEINLNCGCPSDRVRSGRFGACLMLEPALVADCVAAMRAAVPAHVPVTVKCRLGVDEIDDEDSFRRFIDTVASAGCAVFVVHARKAWLSGLSPRENREIPPLDYDRVHRLKADRPQLTVVLNGGLRELADIEQALANLDGVMLGRAAYHEPYLLAGWQQALFARPASMPTRADVLARMRPYIAAHLAAGGELRHIGRHLLGLYQGEPGARAFRRTLSQARPHATLVLLEQALGCVERRVA
ncbi:MAG: tRNA dihydrouridine(20/20a) synthase DusA [Xanthomonadales bacterium]|nr:tRNA dihydrouridine(20/20a) synthase DusA [Xanthomonadales bacterium]MCE7931541.1 tRNA dihydrouridine(20/20a) synthase DusA [Xanthomonadales bacterium PRO6]